MKTNTGTALQSSSIRVDNLEKRPQRLTILKHSQEPYFSDELQLGTNEKQKSHCWTPLRSCQVRRLCFYDYKLY